MRAMVLPRFGGPGVFELRDIDAPKPQTNEILVRIVYSGTNPVDAKVRANGTWAGLVPPVVLGYDASGVVESLGPDAVEFKPGDEVYYTPEIFSNPLGTYAEYNAVSERFAARKPHNLSHEEAAAVPLAGGTAWEAMVRRLRVQSGETVLIHGGAGGVGHFAVQIAKAAGARVLATASTRNQDVLRRLGADVAIDYTREDFVEVALAETIEGVDAVLDTVGGDLIARSIPATRPFGRLACILTPQGNLEGFYTKNLTLHGVFLTRESKRLREMRQAIEEGALRPLIAQALPLEEVRLAHERLDSGHGAGKIVLQVALD